MTNLQTIGNDLFWLAMDQWILSWQVLELERELAETDIAKKIVAKRREIIEIQKKEEEIKTVIKEWMLAQDIKSVEYTNQKVTLKKSPWAIKVLNEDDIPGWYFNEKVVKSLDKKMLKEWLNLWDIVPWAILNYTYSLVITSK